MIKHENIWKSNKLLPGYYAQVKPPLPEPQELTEEVEEEEELPRVAKDVTNFSVLCELQFGHSTS